jgi:hypothetical protein
VPGFAEEAEAIALGKVGEDVNAGASADLGERNDVPRGDGDEVGSDEVDCIGRVGALAAAAIGTGDGEGAAVAAARDGADLDAVEPGAVHDEIVGRAVTQRAADGESQGAGAICE